MSKDNSLQKQIWMRELIFQNTRSQGPGGQHVNRTESAVIVRWNVQWSQAFRADDISWLLDKLASKLNAEGEICLKSDSSRERLRNKDDVTERLWQIIQQTLARPKIRKKTKPTYSSQRKRVSHKREHSAKKNLRQRVHQED